MELYLIIKIFLPFQYDPGILLWGEDLDCMHGIEVFTSGNISFNWQMQQSNFLLLITRQLHVYVI